MKSNNGKKIMSIEDDRLSRLPDELIHNILFFVGLKHAIQMSVLSSRWRLVWTSMPYLDFSRDDFSSLLKVSEFVTHVLSGRNNQTEVVSVKLRFHGEDSNVFVEQIINYAFSHGIQQLNVKCSSYVIKATSTWELSALTTLYLNSVSICCDENDENTDKCIDLFSKCANLKNLTLKDCYTKGFKGLNICLPLLSSLTLKHLTGSLTVCNMVAPKLKNLTIRCCFFPCHQLSTDDFLSLEKADINVYFPRNAHQFLRLLQQIHNVKFLTLNLEILELLSSHVELILHQSSPFANLKSLKIYSEREELKREKMSAEVKSYLLDSSPGATFTMVSREDVRAIKNKKLAENLITKLQELLEQEKARIDTKMAKMVKLQDAQVDNHIYRYNDRRWDCLGLQVEKDRERASDIISKLKEIKDLLRELPASLMAIIQPSFSALCTEANIVMNRITDSMKMNCDQYCDGYQRRLSVCFHELATTLEPSS